MFLGRLGTVQTIIIPVFLVSSDGGADRARRVCSGRSAHLGRALPHRRGFIPHQPRRTAHRLCRASAVGHRSTYACRQPCRALPGARRRSAVSWRTREVPQLARACRSSPDYAAKVMKLAIFACYFRPPAPSFPYSQPRSVFPSFAARPADEGVYRGSDFDRAPKRCARGDPAGPGYQSTRHIDGDVDVAWSRRRPTKDSHVAQHVPQPCLGDGGIDRPRSCRAWRYGRNRMARGDGLAGDSLGRP